MDLPHDWSIEGAAGQGQSDGSGGGYFPAGTGWYRKTFSAPAEWKGKRVSVEFDGVYRDATVYMNGHKLGTQPYGYTSFRFDLTPDLDFAGPNVLAVRVDNSAQPNSRWYSGSGIYRHVRVVVTGARARGALGRVRHDAGGHERGGQGGGAHAGGQRIGRPRQVDGGDALIDRAGKTVGQRAIGGERRAGRRSRGEPGDRGGATGAVVAGDAGAVQGRHAGAEEGKVVDEVVTPFGIRSLAWSAGEGAAAERQVRSS